jgi:hypothetical protein
MNYGAMLGLALDNIHYSSLDDGCITRTGLASVSYIIMIAGIVLATKTFRDQEQGGFITYGRALAVGTLTCVFAGVITGFFHLFVVYRY